DPDPHRLGLQIGEAAQVHPDPEAVGRVVPAVAGRIFPGVPTGIEQQPERTELQRVTPAATRRVLSEPAEPDLGRPPEPGRLVVEEGAVDAAERALSASGQRIAAVE